MSETQVIEIVNRALYLIVKVSAPVVGGSIIIPIDISVDATTISMIMNGT